jgi:hypothetical protein
MVAVAAQASVSACVRVDSSSSTTSPPSHVREPHGWPVGREVRLITKERVAIGSNLQDADLTVPRDDDYGPLASDNVVEFLFVQHHSDAFDSASAKLIDEFFVRELADVAFWHYYFRAVEGFLLAVEYRYRFFDLISVHFCFPLSWLLTLFASAIIIIAIAPMTVMSGHPITGGIALIVL